MGHNIFLGDGFFGSRQVPTIGPTLGQMKYGYPSSQTTRPESALVSRPKTMLVTKPPTRTTFEPGPRSLVTRETSDPMAFSSSPVLSGGDSELGQWTPPGYQSMLQRGQQYSTPWSRGGVPSSIPARPRVPQSYQWAPRTVLNPASRITRPTAQPTAAGSSDLHCYFCGNLEDKPTYWMSEAQAAQWNASRNADCVQVSSTECQKKYGQINFGFNAFNLPGSATYASTLSGRIPVQNPELLG